MLITKHATPITHTATSGVIYPPQSKGLKWHRIRVYSAAWDASDWLEITVSDGVNTSRYLGAMYRNSHELVILGRLESVSIDGTNVTGLNTSALVSVESYETEPPAMVTMRTCGLHTADGAAAIVLPERVDHPQAIHEYHLGGVWSTATATLAETEESGATTTVANGVAADWDFPLTSEWIGSLLGLTLTLATVGVTTALYLETAHTVPVA